MEKARWCEVNTGPPEPRDYEDFNFVRAQFLGWLDGAEFAEVVFSDNRFRTVHASRIYNVGTDPDPVKRLEENQEP